VKLRRRWEAVRVSSAISNIPVSTSMATTFPW